MRQLARALTGFRNDWTDVRADPLPLRPQVPRPTGRSRSTAGAASTPGRRACGWSPAIAATPSSWSPSCGATSSRRKPSAATTKQLARLYVERDREVRPLLEAILSHPDLYDPGKRMVKPPVVQAAGMLRAVGRGIDTPAWAWLCESAGQYLFMPPNVSGWDDTRWLDTATFRARWQMAQQICNPAQLDPETVTDVPSDPAELVRRAAAFWGSPALSGPVRDGLERYAADTLATADQALDAGELPRAGAQRAADARRHLPRLPDELSMDCCTEHARASAGLPAIEPGMPEPAGTGLSRRSLLLRGAGLGLAVYGAGKLAQLPAFETGVAAAQGAGPNTVLLNVFMDGGVDSLSLLAPVGDPHYRKLRPTLARRRTAARSPRTRACAGTRRRARSPTCTPRARSPCCPRSATPTPTSRTSPRATSGRSARSTPTCARAGSAACSTSSARPTTRCRASRSTASSRPRWRPRATRWRRSTSPRTSASGRPAPGGRRRSSRCRRSPASAAR